MITLQQTAGNNNQTIWLIKINTDTPIYLSTKDITLDSTFDGQALNYENYLSDLTFPSTVRDSGGAGSVTSFSFSISRHVSNSSLDGFFNEFYPATSGVYLSGTIVQFGICWDGATADSDITWLFNGRIVDCGYDQRRINITVFQESEITNKELPHYEIQRDNAFILSYYEYEDVQGRVIPIVYGSLNSSNVITRYFSGTPAILAYPQTNSYVIASHRCYGGSVLMRYVPSLDTYMEIYTAGATETITNSDTRYTLNASTEEIKGTLFVNLTQNSQESDYSAITAITNRDDSDYYEISESSQLALRALGQASTSEVGFLNPVNVDVTVVFGVASSDGTSRSVTVTKKNNNLSVPVQSTGNTGQSIPDTTPTTVYYDFGTSTSAKINADLPWTIEEVCALDYILINEEVTAGKDVRVYYGYVHLSNIKLAGSMLFTNSIKIVRR